jgi:hypothetical protein
MEYAVKIYVWVVIACEVLSILAAFRFVAIPSYAKAGQKVLPFAMCVGIAALALLVAFVLLDRLTAGTTSPVTTAFILTVAFAFSLGGQYITDMLFRK